MDVLRHGSPPEAKSRLFLSARRWALAGAAVCLLLSQRAFAQPVPESSDAPPPAVADYPITRIGLQLDGGLPGGAGATLLYRPWWWLRLNGGLAYDVVGFGYRGGVSLAPGHWVVTPTLNFDAGHYVSGDATRFVSTSDPNEIALLHHATYDFGSAQIGLEIGSQRRFTFYLRGGVAYVRTHAAGSDLTNLVNGKSGSSASSYTVGDLNLSMLIPCVSLGFLIYIF